MRRRLALLSFGGTISQQSGPGGPSAPGFDVRRLTTSILDLDVEVEHHVVAQIGSKDVQPAHWIRATNLVTELLDRPDPPIDGVVLLHGTDTLHYTAAALSFALRAPDVPVVLTGSMRPGGDDGSDARANLRASVVAACDPRLRGVSIVFSDRDDLTRATILAGTNARKTHSSSPAAFGPYEVANLGHVEQDEVRLAWGPPRRAREPLPSAAFDSRVPILKASPGLGADHLTAVLALSSGLVIEGTGVGHVPTSWIPALAGFPGPIVAATQVAAGGERLGAYRGDRELLDLPNVMPAGRMSSETAQVKLMWALAHPRAAVDAIMRRDVCGEMATRT
ncbi:asparaginase [Nocardioides zeae]|uniref:asparaginase n=1 Tax=Nocardioides zeae TaxID=1457234 RepID=UPI0027D78433|nr:asparaginase [Nocardioides zeae]